MKSQPADEGHRTRTHRADEHDTSTEAEIRAILEEAVLPPRHILPGSGLKAFGRKYGPSEARRESGKRRDLRVTIE